MTRPGEVPEGQIADAVKGNWVDRHAPEALKPYFRLSRLDRPIGTWLLLLPCWWGLFLAMATTGTASWHDAWIFAGCGIGAVLMRGAGCTWNDITDRDIDGSVARTAKRPIPAGDVSAKQALAWGVGQCLLAFLILLSFNAAAILLGILALVPVTIYPFAKRFTWWPQIFLGLAFNWGALLAWTAHTGSLGVPAVLLYVAGMAWTLFYDTIYAHQDKEDDALIGVKSTARLFGEMTPRVLVIFLVTALALMATAVWGALGAAGAASLGLALAGVAAFGAHMAWQLSRVDLDNHDVLLALFRSNRDAGLLPVLFFACAAIL
ncbi:MULTISPECIES: 4-hydroxybenzoate octaprenyltransferase [unclassified Roseivivax]|uniref:4-hydroxybenzoate octaprenyltransferase n=1 Tax=Roseivivax sp. GX 12232 TaxID=2900547 RepID=UPI001E327741|nr:4-hydroxybenzoate octaprenyltransferase [Roseivivax sp. GX 12232]MCE0506011.1 4-hydroxybenzoate octaprenyltransferase [Roseivivax sp. GX 12232]